MADKEMKTAKMIAYCGVDCSECDDFKYNICLSCKLTKWTEDDICMPVKCCREKKIEYCSQCTGFPCKDMKDFYEESGSHREAFRRMIKMCSDVNITLKVE